MRHFLVVAAASRGGRLFIKKALQAGHNITALCRASSDEAATERLTKLLEEADLTPGGPAKADRAGKLVVKNNDILRSDTYQTIISEDPTIDGLVNFVGPTKIKELMSRKTTLYTDTISAMVEGMKQSHAVEVIFHSSVGTEGVPRDAVLDWPANFSFLSKLLVPIFFPVFNNVTLSERLLARSDVKDLSYIVFRPATLTDGKAMRHYGYAIDNSSDNQQTIPMSKADTKIAREDVAEEILRVATLPSEERKKFYGHAIYLADLKPQAE